eukprot:1612930-Rhodomonas_salina.11
MEFVPKVTLRFLYCAEMSGTDIGYAAPTSAGADVGYAATLSVIRMAGVKNMLRFIASTHEAMLSGYKRPLIGPTPYALRPTPYTPHPTPWTLDLSTRYIAG